VFSLINSTMLVSVASTCKDIHAVYAEWSARGAQFPTPPKQHPFEIRCYIRDPDGNLIEVGQTTNRGGTGRPHSGPRVRPTGRVDECANRTRQRIHRDHLTPGASDRLDPRRGAAPVGYPPSVGCAISQTWPSGSLK
jgi:Glyoxalase/Bleomycin resistance protein/Dioxygenase superfamily